MSCVHIESEVKLKHLKPGTHFKFGDIVGFKSNGRTRDGAVEAYVVGSGERFTGGTDTTAELNNLVVTPLRLDGIN